MRKLLLVSAACAVSFAGFAQNAQIKNGVSPIKNVTSERTARVNLEGQTANKSTGVTDTFTYLTNYQIGQAFDSATIYSVAGVDSGLFFGTNAYGFSAFGEYFGVNYLADTSVKIAGVFTLFVGRVQTSSTKTINFKVWNVDADSTLFSTKTYLIETPGTQLYSQTASIHDLGLVLDTPSIKYTAFNSLVTTDSSFYLGYDINYQFANLGGDTIGLACTRDTFGWGHGQGYVNNTTQDTFLFAQTVMRMGTEWLEAYWSAGLDVNMSIAPYIFFEGGNVFPVSAASVSNRNLTIFGNYPNPASTSTTIKYSLGKADNVTIQIVDLTGRVINTISENNQSAGEHTVAVDVTNMAAGNYAYIITAKAGGSLAAQLSVIK